MSAEVETTINRFRESVQTISMFGGKRVVIWLKDVNFLADTMTGRAESTLPSSLRICSRSWKGESRARTAVLDSPPRLH